jgi:predicted AlkP superfamily pyrophosphatase or phosphodiesterase
MDSAGRMPRLSRRSLVFVGRLVVACLAIIAGCEHKSPASAEQSAPAPAAAPKPGRVLFIGIDGCRFDALEKSNAPHLDKLRAAGCYADNTLIQGDRYKGSDTVSGPGWSSLLTGVWADKHGIVFNRFLTPRFDKCPMFFRRLHETDPKAETAAFSTWPPISEEIVTDADLNLMFTTDEHYKLGDKQAAEATNDSLRRGDPKALFCYFGQVDEHGHQHGFSPDVPEYIAAIERVDALVGTVIDALQRRKNYAAENWLVLVSTDHGGLGTDHKNGRDEPKIIRSFTIVSGPAAKQGKLKEQTYIVDVPVTALVHLGVAIKPEWELDGKAVGLKGR